MNNEELKKQEERNIEKWFSRSVPITTAIFAIVVGILIGLIFFWYFFINILAAGIFSAVIGCLIALIVWKDEEKRATGWKWKVKQMKQDNLLIRVMAIGALTGVTGVLIAALIVLICF